MSLQLTKYITIGFVPNDRVVIALTLEYLQLCKVLKICVFPDFRRGELCYSAFIEVAEWMDSEAAYSLIKKIRDPLKEARIIYEDDKWWAVEETAEPDLCFTQDVKFKKWTSEFKQAPIVEAKSPRHVTFKREHEHEPDIDLRTAVVPPGFDFVAFCIDYGLAHGFDFEAEYEKAAKEGEAKEGEAKEGEAKEGEAKEGV